MFRSLLITTLAVIVIHHPAWAQSEDAKCPSGSDAVMVPASVDVQKIQAELQNLETGKGKGAFKSVPELMNEVQTIFDPTSTKTKMEQFYQLLYLIARELPNDSGDIVELKVKPVRALLLDSKVFIDPKIPGHITDVQINRKSPRRPRYTIAFGQPETVFELNKGEGFYLFRNGKCQHAQKLIFENVFSVELEKNSKGNLIARNFKGVNLFGDFGNRGVIDVDIQYIELRTVEFYHGTNLGKVTVYVSEEEFRKNKHNPILKMITKMVPDRTVQPIDW